MLRRLPAVHYTQIGCEVRGIVLTQLTPVIVAAYIEDLGQQLDKPSVKQHLAALRMLPHVPGNWHYH